MTVRTDNPTERSPSRLADILDAAQPGDVARCVAAFDEAVRVGLARSRDGQDAGMVAFVEQYARALSADARLAMIDLDTPLLEATLAEMEDLVYDLDRRFGGDRSP